MSVSALPDIPGGKVLIDWFGHVPRFHDGNLLNIMLSGSDGGTGLMRIHAWNMTSEVDARGYFILHKHAVVTLALKGVNSINLTDTDMVPAIIFDMDFTKAGEHVRIEWDTSYGMSGFITAKNVQISLTPGKPESDSG